MTGAGAANDDSRSCKRLASELQTTTAYAANDDRRSCQRPPASGGAASACRWSYKRPAVELQMTAADATSEWRCDAAMCFFSGDGRGSGRSGADAQAARSYGDESGDMLRSHCCCKLLAYAARRFLAAGGRNSRRAAPMACQEPCESWYGVARGFFSVPGGMRGEERRGVAS